MSSADLLIQSLRHQPLLVVLRPATPLAAEPQLQRLQELGLRHVEIAWQAGDVWGQEMAALVGRFPELELGAASVCEPEGVAAAAAAGCRYAVSPVLEASLLSAAAARDLVLVPGVMSASEVHAARRLGCRVVKLFPAVSVGIDHWRRRCPSASPPAGWGRRMWPPGWPPGSMRWPWGRRWGIWRSHGRSWRRHYPVRCRAALIFRLTQTGSERCFPNERTPASLAPTPGKPAAGAGVTASRSEDGQLRTDMLKQRNLMAHTYDVRRARIALALISEHYAPALGSLAIALERRP